uniref:3-dehydrosphinganine reductase n=1 Tax=Haemonchus contortus TaxID=6289 RepID=A0A7I4YHE8_HAECO
MIPPWLAIIIVIGVIIGLIAFLVLYFSLPSRKSFDLTKKHAVVTGGSKGIGKQLALSLLSRGCNVSIIARKEVDLRAACKELQTVADQRGQNQKVRWYSLDLTKGYREVEYVFRLAEKELGPVDALINNAGNSVQGAFEDLPIEDFEKQVKVNYLSAIYATRCVIKGMKSRRSGHISFVSSAAGQCAIYGYTAYAPTKFALRGFADALQMELSPYNVNVSVLYPPNTDTEGYKAELASMPEEVQLISETAGLFSPKEVADAHVVSIEAGYYSTPIGLDGWMLNILTAGASPERSMIDALTQIMLGGILRGVMLVYLGYFTGIVKKCYRRRLIANELHAMEHRSAGSQTGTSVLSSKKSV